jgi:uncharacterized protein
MRLVLLVLVISLCVWPGSEAFAQTGATNARPDHQRRVLVYTRNGVGYVHANIPASVEALKRLGAEAGFTVDSSEDPAAFSDANLTRYAVIVFDNSNNEIFSTDTQRQALKDFVEHGGGVVGVHSAIGSERNWDWFAQMMGGRFRWHPVEQDFTVNVVKPRFPVVQELPTAFTVHDECYFIEKLNPGAHPVLTTDPTALAGRDKAPMPLGNFPNPLPLAWYQTFDGGRELYLALGHEASDYSQPWFAGMLQRAIVWAAGSEEAPGRER